MVYFGITTHYILAQKLLKEKYHKLNVIFSKAVKSVLPDSKTQGFDGFAELSEIVTGN